MIDPNSLKVTELKAELTARGLSTKGVKKDLVTRLEEALANDGTTTGSATEPDVPHKDTDMDISANNNDDNASSSEHDTPTSTQEEAKEIAQIAPPVAEPLSAPAEADIVMAPAPVPVPASSTEPLSSIEGIQASTAATITPDPALGTSSLSQEGLIDTTMTPPAERSIESKKRSLETDDNTGASSSGSSNGESSSRVKETPAKKQKAIAINRDGNEQIIAAAKETLEADARRRSAAPSPSPAPPAHPGRTLSSSTIATVAEVTTPPAAAIDSDAADSPATGSPSGPRSPSEDKKAGGNERRDVRSQFQRSIQLAAQDRKTEATSKSSTASPTTTSASVVLPEPASVKDDPNPTVKRALTITNFVRPLVISQVKRMLSEYGEIETLWLDSIKTHCYVVFKETAEAEKAYNHTNNMVFPQETGKALKPYFISAEAARNSIAAAELAQKSGKKPVIYTGTENVAPAAPAPAERPKAEPKSKTIAVQRDATGVIFKRPQVQVVQPTELFNMTKAKPMLYYKAVKEPPTPASPKETDAPAPLVAEAN